MFGPAFTALWLLSLVVVSTVALRFVYRLSLGAWLLVAETLGSRGLNVRLDRGRRGPRTPIRVVPPRRRGSAADSRAAA